MRGGSGRIFEYGGPGAATLSLPQRATICNMGAELTLTTSVGLPQVSGRIATMGFREWVDLDLTYRRTWSIGLDMEIITKTVSIFFRELLSRPGPDHY